MVNHLSNVKFGYTDHGSRYEKSSDGKKTGKIAGAVAGVAVAATKTASLNADIIKRADNIMPSVAFLYNTAGSGGKVVQDTFTHLPKSTIKRIPMQDKIAELLSEFKGAKVGFVAATVVGTIALCTLAGRLIGGIYDKAVDNHSKHKADNAALDKAVQKKDEE